MAARLLIRTGPRALVRRSTIGDGVRSCHQDQTGSTSAAMANSPSVVLLVQPHAPPLDTASRKATSPTDNAIAPRMSKLSSAATLIGEAGTTRRVSTTNSAERPP